MAIEIKLCNKIQRLPKKDAQYDNNRNIIPVSGKAWIPILEAKGQFSEESKDTDGGMLWIQKLDISCELSNSEVSDIIMMPHVYKLSFSDDTSGIYGCLEIPVVFPKIKGIKTQKQVSFERTSLVPEF